MTPEPDWAEKKAREVAMSLPPSDFGSHPAIMSFAQALREAVKAERAACLTIAENYRHGEPRSSRARGYDHACDNIAAAIRARTP